HVTAAALERRARLRRFVAGVIAFATVVSVFVVARRFLHFPPSKTASASTETSASNTSSAVDEKKALEAKAAEEAKKKALAEEEAKKKAAEEAEAKKKAEEEAKKKSVDVDALKKKGMLFVNSFRYKDAIETGKQLIE